MGVVRLEDVAAHVHTGSALLQSVVGHLQRIQFRQLLAASDHDRHRTAAGHSFEFGIGVITFHHVTAQFRHDAGGEAEILWRASHGATHRSDAHDSNAITAGLIDEVREVLESLALVFTTDEHLHSQNRGVQADGVFDAAGQAFIGKRLITGGGPA